MKNDIFITGDCHGSFYKIERAVETKKIKENDCIILLGDSGINFYYPNTTFKDNLSKLNINYFIIHGNHDGPRPNKLPTYTEIDYNEGRAYIEKDYPNIIYAKFGEIYNFNIDGSNKKCLVLDGAYSVDKYCRIGIGYGWWECEQPTEDMKIEFENKLKTISDIDFVFTHTCPYNFEPRHLFLNGIDQSTVDNSYEKWLQFNIYDKLNINNIWYCAHFHNDEMLSDNIHMLYHSILKLGE